MKKFLVIALLAALASCGYTGNKSGPGVFLTETKDPIFYNNNVRQRKTGTACSTRVLTLVATGDASIQAAKNNGNITKVASADTEYFNILGVYGKACTIVTGE